MIKLLIFIISLLITGCVTMRQPLNNFDLQESSNLQNTGYLAGSYIRDYFVIMKMFIGPPFKIKLEKLNNDGTVEKNLSFDQTLDLTKEKKIFFFKIEPGRYKIKTFEIGFVDKNENIIFTIEKGSIHYIGHFQIAKDASLNIICNRIDDSQKDIDILKTTYPLISKLKIVNIAK